MRNIADPGTARTDLDQMVDDEEMFTQSLMLPDLADPRHQPAHHRAYARLMQKGYVKGARKLMLSKVWMEATSENYVRNYRFVLDDGRIFSGSKVDDRLYLGTVAGMLSAIVLAVLMGILGHGGGWRWIGVMIPVELCVGIGAVKFYTSKWRISRFRIPDQMDKKDVERLMARISNPTGS